MFQADWLAAVAHTLTLRRVPAESLPTPSTWINIRFVLTRVTIAYMEESGSIQWSWNCTEVAPCVALTPILHLCDVEALFLLRLFRVSTTGYERAQRDVLLLPHTPPPPSPSPTDQNPPAGGGMDNSISHWQILSILNPDLLINSILNIGMSNIEAIAHSLSLKQKVTPLACQHEYASVLYQIRGLLLCIQLIYIEVSLIR